MKGYKIMGFIWILIAVLFLILLVMGMNKKQGFSLIEIHSSSSDEKTTGPTSLTGSYDFAKEEISNIDIDLSSENVFIEKSDSDRVKVELYSPEGLEPTVKIYKNTLKIESVKRFILINISERKVIVKIPEDFELNDFDISCSSGEVNIDGIRINKSDINSSSGSVKLKNIKGTALEIKASSGRIKIEDSMLETLNISSSSGSIRLSSSAAKSLEVRSASGSIDLEGEFDGFEIKSSSGSINTDFKKAFTESSEINAVSGSVSINLPHDAGYDVKYSCTSGEYRNENTGTKGKKGSETVNGGGAHLEVSAVSGSIRIK